MSFLRISVCTLALLRMALGANTVFLSKKQTLSVHSNHVPGNRQGAFMKESCVSRTVLGVINVLTPVPVGR